MVEADAVGRVGREQRRLLAGHQQLDLGGVGRIAAEQAVRTELVQLTRLRLRLGRRLGERLLTVFGGGAELAQNLVDRRLGLGQEGDDLADVQLGQDVLQELGVGARVVAAASPVQGLGEQPRLGVVERDHDDRRALVTELAQDPQAVVARQHLEAALDFRVRAGDQVLDDAEALDRAADLRQH